MQPLALQPALHVGERDHHGVDLAGRRSACAAARGRGSGRWRAHRGLLWLPVARRAVIRAGRAAARRCRRSAPPSPGAPRSRRARRGPPRRSARAGCRSASMLASSTGIALSISCSVACTDGHRLDDPREPVSAAMVEVEARVGLPVHRPGRVALTTAAWAALQALALLGVAASMPAASAAAPGSTMRRKSSASCQSARRAAVRRDARPRRRGRGPHRDHGAAAAPAGGLHQSGLRAARPSPRAGWPGRRPAARPARARAAACCPAGRRPAGSRVASCSTQASKAWWPRTGRSTVLAQAVDRAADPAGDGRSGAAEVTAASLTTGTRRCQWSEFKPFSASEPWTGSQRRV